MESIKLSFLAVVRGHTQYWKGDAYFRSQFSQEYLIRYNLMINIFQIAKTEIRKVRFSSNTAYDREKWQFIRLGPKKCNFRPVQCRLKGPRGTGMSKQNWEGLPFPF